MGIMYLFKKKKSGFENKVPPFDTDMELTLKDGDIKFDAWVV